MLIKPDISLKGLFLRGKGLSMRTLQHKCDSVMLAFSDRKKCHNKAGQQSLIKDDDREKGERFTSLYE